MARGKRVKGRRVYVTFLHDGTVALHPSNCTGRYYRMRSEGSVHLGKRISAKDLGEAILNMRAKCKVD